MPYVSIEYVNKENDKSAPSKINKSRKQKIDLRRKNLILFSDIESSLMLTYSMLLQVSLPKLPTVWALRIFIGWWWLYSILITVTYRASLTAALANPFGR